MLSSSLWWDDLLIGGYDALLALSEDGRLEGELDSLGARRRANATGQCRACAGVTFVLCAVCRGSTKVADPTRRGESMPCGGGCNENGLVQCACALGKVQGSPGS